MYATFFCLVLSTADDYIFVHHVVYLSNSISRPGQSDFWENLIIPSIVSTSPSMLDGRIFEVTWLADLESSTVGEKNVCSNIGASFHEVHDSSRSAEIKKVLGYLIFDFQFQILIFNIAYS